MILVEPIRCGGSKVSCFGGLFELVCDFGYGWLRLHDICVGLVIQILKGFVDLLVVIVWSFGCFS